MANDPAQSKVPIVTWMAAWILLIGGVYALSKTAWGLTIIYYTIWLAILLLLVAHYEEIVNIFTQGNITQGNF